MTSKIKQQKIDLSRDSKELFEQRYVKVFDQNQNYRRGAKSENRHPSWLYFAVVGLSEAATGGVV